MKFVNYFLYLTKQTCKKHAKMATVRLILDTRSRKKEGSYPINLSVSHKTVTSFIGMAISVTEDQWSGKEVVNHPKAKMFNSILKSKLSRAENMIFHLTSSGRLRNLSQKELLNYIETNDFEPEPKQDYQVETHFKKYISRCKTERTKEIYQETLVKLQSFSPQLTFDQLNGSWLKSFDDYMAKTCKTNTRAIHMRNIRAVFNDAINEDLVSQNIYQFRKFKIKKRSLEPFPFVIRNFRKINQILLAQSKSNCLLCRVDK